jgi:hypothetical protein
MRRGYLNTHCRQSVATEDPMASLFMTEVIQIISAHTVSEDVCAPHDDDIVLLGEMKPLL